MPTPQQQNYREIVDAVLKKFPLYDAILARQDVNDHLRTIMARRSWSGLVKYSILSVPDQYKTGTVSVTQFSNVLDGVNTAWPVNDIVNTTLSSAPVQTGIVDMTPAVMTNIIPGRWLTIDGGNAGEEGIFVISVDLQAGTFRARSNLVHPAGVTVTRGSLAGRQFRVNSLTPFVTVVGFTSPTRALIDIPWPYSTLATQSYEITMVYVSLGQDLKEILTMVNTDRQYQFYVWGQKGMLDAKDPRRATSQMPYILAFHETDPAGAPLYEVYPRPTSAAAYPYFYVRQWAPLADDNDILPNGIRSDVLVKFGKAEAARWPGHKKLEGGIYYDPKLADSLIVQAETDIAYMKNEDDSTAIMQMISSYRRWRFGGPGADYYQTDEESWAV